VQIGKKFDELNVNPIGAIRLKNKKTIGVSTLITLLKDPTLSYKNPFQHISLFSEKIDVSRLR